MALEVCIDSLESAIYAYNGGADELEVCSSLSEGGLTPSLGLVKSIQNKCPNIKLNIMLRCRAGSDFIYNNLEMETMLSDVEIFKEYNINSFVFGALSEDGKIDRIKCNEIIVCAHPIPVTLHRAFDMTNDLIEELIVAKILGFSRILTSGGCSRADEPKALETLKELVSISRKGIEIMPGAGVNSNNIETIIKTGANIFHSSCKVEKRLPVGLQMGTNDSDKIFVTNETIVKELKEKITFYSQQL